MPAPAYLVGGTPGARGPSSRPPSRPGWPPRGSTWSTWACSPPPAWPGALARGLPAAVISASHNPFADNGIKLFGPGGTKLDGRGGDRGQSRAHWPTPAARADRRRAVGRHGRARGGRDYARPPGGGPRRSAARRAVGRARLRQRRGQRGRPSVFAGLGAAVTSIACRPDGVNINDRCGSTEPGALAAAVVSAGADLGIALDGDADRLVAVDHTGAVADGTPCWPCSPWTWRPRGELPARRGGNGDDQPRVPPGHGRAGDRRARDPGGRPPRAGRARGRGARPGGRAVRPHRLPPPGHHRRRDPDRLGPGRPGGAGGPAPGRPRPAAWSSGSPRSW